MKEEVEKFKGKTFSILYLLTKHASRLTAAVISKKCDIIANSLFNHLIIRNKKKTENKTTRAFNPIYTQQNE